MMQHWRLFTLRKLWESLGLVLVHVLLFVILFLSVCLSVACKSLCSAFVSLRLFMCPSWLLSAECGSSVMDVLIELGMLWQRLPCCQVWSQPHYCNTISSSPETIFKMHISSNDDRTQATCYYMYWIFKRFFNVCTFYVFSMSYCKICDWSRPSQTNWTLVHRGG